MIETVVRYLRSQNVAFRLVSYPSLEAAPLIAHVMRPQGSRMLEASVLRVDGRPAIAAVPRGTDINLLRTQSELGAAIVELGSTGDLPWPYTMSSEPIPALGNIFGAALLVDEALVGAPLVSFPAFSPMDYIEMTYDDYARIEQPRVVALANAGQLPAAPLH